MDPSLLRAALSSSWAPFFGDFGRPFAAEASARAYGIGISIIFVREQFAAAQHLWYAHAMSSFAGRSWPKAAIGAL
jgi:hypothetical protein